MGGSFGSSSEEDFVVKLINLSNSTLSNELVYQIIMKSGCSLYVDTAKELVGLYQRFQGLDTDKKGALSNKQFLLMDEFQYNPFKERLGKAIPFRTDEYIQRFKHSVRIIQSVFDAPTGTQNTPATDNRQPSKSAKIQPEETKVEEPPTKGAETDVETIPYIDFEQFTVYLSVFCPRCPNDLKIGCKSHSVLYRLYDVDGDGVLSRYDLAATLKLLVGETMPQPEIEEVVKKVFKEVDVADKGNIDKEDFQKVMWITDFDQKTSMRF